MHQQTAPHSTSELLPWLFQATDSVIVCKDSSLLAVWEIGGLDYESNGQDALDAMSEQVDEALRRIADYGIRFWSLFLREQADDYPYGNFAENDRIAAYIDQVWGRSLGGGRLFRNRHFIAVAMPVGKGTTSVGELAREHIDAGSHPLAAALKAAKSALFRAQDRLGFTTRAELDVLVRRFEGNIARLISDSMAVISPRRLVGDELLGVLKATASTSGFSRVVAGPYDYLDALLSDTEIDNTRADYLLFSGRKTACVGVVSLKSAPRPNLLQHLNPVLALPIRFRVSVVWQAYSIPETEKFLSSSRQYSEMASLRLRKMLKRISSSTAASSPLDEDDDPTTREGVVAEQLRDAARSKTGRFGAMAASVAVYADTPEELEVQMEMLSRALEATGYVFYREREGSLSALCCGIPGHMRHVVRWHFVEACSATDAATLISMDSGDPTHPFFSEVTGQAQPPNAVFVSRYGTAQFFNYHEGQLGHTVIVGPSRNGKTMWQMFMETQFLKYPNARIFNLDKDLSCKPTTLLLDGTHIDLDPSRGGGVRLNPISMIHEPGGVTWLVGWLDRLMAGRGDPLADHELETMSEALKRLQHYPSARLSTLLSQLPESLRARLVPWCAGGAFGQFFDHEIDDFRFDRITTVEVGSLLNSGLGDVVAAFTDYAFQRIERFLMNREPHELGPTLIYFEEAGFLLEDPIFARKAKDYLMTLAKKRAFLVMTAQSPESFIANPILAAAVRDNVATVVLLPNRNADKADLRNKYRQVFGLNDFQIDLVASAVSKQEYCIYKPGTGRFRVVQAKFPREIVSFLRSDADSQAVLNRHYDPADPGWKKRYINALIGA